jgi:hypothetical protein
MLLDRHRFHEAYQSIRAAAASAAGKCSVLIFVAPSCDAMAACRLLSVRAGIPPELHILVLISLYVQALLSSDDVKYKIRPVAGYGDLIDANNELIVRSSTVRA